MEVNNVSSGGWEGTIKAARISQWADLAAFCVEEAVGASMKLPKMTTNDGFSLDTCRFIGIPERMVEYIATPAAAAPDDAADFCGLLRRIN